MAEPTIRRPGEGEHHERSDGYRRILVATEQISVIELGFDESLVVDRWWTEEPVARRYFDVVLETGENAVVYRDDESGSWFTQRA